MTEQVQKKSLWQRYWESLGGWQTLLNDHYFFIGIGLTVLLIPLWLQPLWWDTVITIVSILIGFSVGGFSVVLAISSERLQDRLLRRSEYDNRSPFLMFNAAFAHYLLTGFLALGAALLCKAWYQPQWLPQPESDLQNMRAFLGVFARMLWLLSGFLFCYCLSSGVGAVFFIYRIAEILQKVADHSEKKKKAQSSRPDA